MKIMTEQHLTSAMIIKKPIFIIGVPRSGTTLLYRFLTQHPEIGWFSKETLKKFLTDDYMNFVHLRRRIYGLLSIPYPMDEFTARFFSTMNYPIEAGYLWNKTFQKNWECKVAEKNLVTLKQTIVETLDEQKKERFLSKVPKNSIRVLAINKYFPDSKFIHIIRDGRSVVNSMLRRAVENPLGYFGIPLKTNDEKMTVVEKHTLQWIQVINDIRKASTSLEKNQYLEIKYEDLIKKPARNLSIITKFCELSPFGYVYKKEPIHKKLLNKIPFVNIVRDPGWEMRKNIVKIVENRNKRHKNDKEIKKLAFSLLKEFSYV